MIFMTMEPPTIPTYGSKMEKIECVASVIRKDSMNFLDMTLSSFDTMVRLSMTNPMTAVKNRISEIDHLSDNWDGYDAIAPSQLVIKNSFKFIDSLVKAGIDNIEPDDIYPMTYGSVVIELNNGNGMISIEIGQHSIGFFTDFVRHENIYSEGEETDFRSIPEDLRQALKVLRYGAQAYSYS